MSTTDYDELRTAPESLDLLQERTFADVAEAYDLPDFEVVDEELTAPVVPIQADEFRCARCFLVLHQTMRHRDGVCRDCA
jgi:hypothetical protein